VPAKNNKTSTGFWAAWPAGAAADPAVLRQRLGAHRRSGLLYVMLALGLNIVVGYAGLLDLGYVAFYAVGAYMLRSWPRHIWPRPSRFCGHVSQRPAHLDLAGDSAGMLLAACTGCCWGAGAAAARRLPGHRDAGLRRDHPHLHEQPGSPVNITNGPKGMARSTRSDLRLRPGQAPEIFGYDISSVTLYYYLFLVLVLATVVICYRLQDSRIGRAWMAIREDEIAAKAMGINTRNMKLLAFGMGAIFGGVAGAMFGAFQGFVSPESFSLMESVMIVAMVVLGGMGHIPGVILGRCCCRPCPRCCAMWPGRCSR
jgi:branched-chain amino acid transport system permease protein